MCLGPEEAKAYSLNILFLGKSNCLIHRMESVLSFWFHQFVIWKQIHRERYWCTHVWNIWIQGIGIANPPGLGWYDNLTMNPGSSFPYQCLSCIHRMKGQDFERERKKVVPRIQWHRRRKLSKSFTSLCAYGMLEVTIFAKRTQMVLHPSFLFHISNKSITTTTTATHPFNKPTVINDHKKKQKKSKECQNLMLGLVENVWYNVKQYANSNTT